MAICTDTRDFARIAQIKVTPASCANKPGDTDWVNPPEALTPFGVAARFLIDEVGEVVPAAWKLAQAAQQIGLAA